MSRPTRTLASVATSFLAVLALGGASVVPTSPAAASPISLPANSSLGITASTAGTQVVGVTSNVWGTATGAGNQQIWTEVLVGGQWSRSQVRTTNASGYYVIPLTYGQNATGTYTYRVGTSTGNGVAYSPEVRLTRVGSVSLSTAGSRPVGTASNAWGTVSGASNVEVWTEAYVNGRWSRSQTRTTNSSGYYAIPLTYGQNSAGTYSYRVGARTPAGVVYSPQTSFRRVGPVTANTAGRQHVGVTSHAWGTVGGAPGRQVWTEALVNGRWSPSQTTTTDSNGYYEIPLTYGENTAGTDTFRVRAHTRAGVLYSSPVTLERIHPGPTGTKYTWMRQAGIPQSEWQYVDYIVSRESNWNPSARNPYSGACGLAQVYPCSKVGGNWDDPVTSLRWQYNYVKSRYGSYQGAYNFWLRNRWY